MKEFLCILFGHKPIDEKLIFKSETSELKTFTANCSRCKCKLIGKEDRGKISKKMIKSYVELN